MADIHQWRRKIQSSRSRTPLPGTPAEHDYREPLTESASNPATPRRKIRPKISSYFSHYIPSTTHQPKSDYLSVPEPTDFAVPRSVGTIPEPPSHHLEAEQLIDSIMRTLLCRPYEGLDAQHNSSILMIIEAYRNLKDEIALLECKVQEEVHARFTVMMDAERSEKQWEVERQEYKAEVKRLELLISRGKKGLVGVINARQGSVLRGRRKQTYDDQNDDKETVFEFLERTRQEDETARVEQRGTPERRSYGLLPLRC